MNRWAPTPFVLADILLSMGRIHRWMVHIKPESADAIQRITQPFVIESAISMIYEEFRAMRRNLLEQPSVP